MRRNFVSMSLVALLLASMILVQGVALAQEPAVNGLVRVSSASSVDETVNRLRGGIEDQGLTVMTTLDHAANAQNAGLDLPPTTLIIFGNPNLGTQLMQSNQTVGIDLPQKYLVWEESDGQVYVAYNEPDYLVSRHTLEGVDQPIAQVSNALSNFATSVASSEEMATMETEAEEMPAMEQEDAQAPAMEAETGQTQESEPESLPATGGERSWLPGFFIAIGLILAGAAFFLRRHSRTGAGLLLLLALPLMAGALASPVVTAQSGNGLVTMDSAYSVDETASRLQSEIENRGPLTLVTTVDHAANAQSVGLELRPTRLLIFGNPNLGTPLMQNSRTVGIDLPQKYLVWEDADGQVHVTYNDPQYLAQRHALQGVDELLTNASNALSGIAETALGQ